MNVGVLEALGLLVMLVTVGLMVLALVDLLRRPAEVWNESNGSQLVWALIVVFVGFIGPVLYLLVARPSLDAAAARLDRWQGPVGAASMKNTNLESRMLGARRVAAVAAFALLLAACGSSTGDTTVVPTTDAPAPTTSTTVGSTAPASPTTPAVRGDDTCVGGAVGTEATVVGVVEYLRVRAEPSTASDEIGRLNLGAAVSVFTDELTYDGSDYWWVPVRLPAAGTCGSAAAGFLADESGRLDQQIPGISFRPPTSGSWTFAERTSRLEPIEALLDGAFYTSYLVMLSDGAQIDQVLADQLAEFEEFEYDYPAEWNQPVTVPGADRAVRLIPVLSSSGDVATDRLLIEIGGYTIEVATSVYIEDFEEAPLIELGTFIDSVVIDRQAFLAAVSG